MAQMQGQVRQTQLSFPSDAFPLASNLPLEH